jgi:hypothetical protein
VSASTPLLDEVLVAMWRKWQRIRAKEKAAWSSEGVSDRPGQRDELKTAVRNLSNLIVSIPPHSATGLVVQLRVLSTVVCQTPPEQIEHADVEEKWLRSILAGAEPLAADALPSWDVDEDASCIGPDG